MKKIFIWDNSGAPGWHIGIAICEDGHILAQHCSSNLNWLKHDMGLTSIWKHDFYHSHCPEGYELIFVEYDDSRLEEPLKKNELIGQTEIDPVVEAIVKESE